MKPVRFLEEAQTEFLEQVSLYEENQKGLGDRFCESIRAATALHQRTRRWGHAKSFPFSVVHRIEPTTGLFAVAHFKRRPAYWRRRSDP